MQGVAGRQKLRKMLFCLAEAVRERVRAKLAAARSLTFHSDASKNRLLLLCEMCGDDFVPGRCFLGTADPEGCARTSESDTLPWGKPKKMAAEPHCERGTEPGVAAAD